uniref:Uncharacterized protein n=2 Tax=Opuntia streptacantha TaxID=393608 RepID=A0A7C9DX49_OPUST
MRRMRGPINGLELTGWQARKQSSLQSSHALHHFLLPWSLQLRRRLWWLLWRRLQCPCWRCINRQLLLGLLICHLFYKFEICLDLILGLVLRAAAMAAVRWLRSGGA